MAQPKYSKRGPGRPKKVVTAAMIRKAEELAAKGLTKAQIARSLGFCYDTLREREKENAEFSEAIKRGQANTIVRAGNALTKAMLSRDKLGNPTREALTAAIFVLKTKAGWSERQIHRVEKSNPLDDLTPDDANRVIAHVLKAHGGFEEARKKFQKVERPGGQEEEDRCSREQGRER